MRFFLDFLEGFFLASAPESWSALISSAERVFTSPFWRGCVAVRARLARPVGLVLPLWPHLGILCRKLIPIGYQVEDGFAREHSVRIFARETQQYSSYSQPFSGHPSAFSTCHSVAFAVALATVFWLPDMFPAHELLLRS